MGPESVQSAQLEYRIVCGIGLYCGSTWGLMAFLEGKRVKAVEGIPVKEEEMLRDVERDVTDEEKRNGKSKRKNHTTGGKGSVPEVKV